MKRVLLATLTVCFLTVTLVSFPQASHADEVGSGGLYVPLPAALRIVDSQSGIGGSSTPFAEGESRTYQAGGTGGIPASASGILVDLGAESATANGYAYIGKAGVTLPALAALRFDPSNTPRSNTAAVPLSADGKFQVVNRYGSSHLRVTVTGYFTAVGPSGPAPGGFVATTPARVLDTQIGLGVPVGQLAGGSTTTLQVGGVGNIPSDATAVFVSAGISYVNTDADIRIWAADKPTPAVSSVEYSTGGPEQDGVMVPLSATGQLKILNAGSDDIHLTLDVQGYVSGNASTGGGYTPVSTFQVWASGTGSASLQPNESREVQVTGIGGLPEIGLGSVMLNVVVMSYTQDGSVELDPSGQDPSGLGNVAFNNNETSPVSATSVVRPGTQGKIVVTNNSSGPVDVRVNAQGWFSAKEVYSVAAHLAGHILDANGSQVPSVPVSLTVLDPDNVRNSTVPWVIAQTSADSTGAYSLDSSGCCGSVAQQLDLRRMVDRYGGFTLEIAAMLSTGPVVTDFSVSSVPNSAPVFDDGTPASNTGLDLQENVGLTNQPVPTTGSASDSNMRTIGAPRDDDRVTFSPEVPQDTDPVLTDSSAQNIDIIAAAGTTCKSDQDLTWIKGQKYKFKWAKLGAMTLQDKVVGSMLYRTSAQTELGTVISGSNGQWFSGGLTHSFSHADDSRITWNFNASWNNWNNNAFEGKFEYRRARAYCVGRFSYSTSNYIDKYKWAPNVFTADSRLTSVLTSWSCGGRYVANVPTGDLLLDKAATNVFSGYFSIAGVGLNSSQSQTSGTSRLFKRRVNSANGIVCGKSTYVSHAGKVREWE